MATSLSQETRYRKCTGIDDRVSWVTKDVAILRYKANLKGSFDGKPFCASLCHRSVGQPWSKWQIVSYQETPVVKQAIRGCVAQKSYCSLELHAAFAASVR